MVENQLKKLLQLARTHPEIKETLLKTRTQKDPMLIFCQTASELGVPISLGELLAAGEEYRSNLLKSVNGGASYPMEDWGDLYEEFFASLLLG